MIGDFSLFFPKSEHLFLKSEHFVSELFSKIVNKLKKNLYSKSKIIINNSDLTDHFADIHHSLGIVDSKIHLNNLVKQMYIHS